MKTSLLFALLLSVAPLVNADSWVLTFEVTEYRIIQPPDGKGAPREERRHFTQQVVFGPDFVAVDGDERRMIYDFARHRITAVDFATNTYSDMSLYALPAFFEHELVNRNMLGAAIRQSGVAGPNFAMSRFDNETTLRLLSPIKGSKEPPPAITAEKRNGLIEFRHDRTVFARCEPSDTPIPTGRRHRFMNYLAYCWPIHPQVRQTIVESGLVPRELTFTGHTTGRVTTTTVKLLAATNGNAPMPTLPTDAKPASTRNRELDSVLATVEGTARDSGRPTRGDTLSFADGAVAEGRPLDAMLALLEFGLQSGERLSDELASYGTVFRSDPACTAYLAGFDQSSKAAAERSLTGNEAISRVGLKKAHMLDLQRANLLEQLGRRDEAIACYLAVLRANPYHVGALHDLGMLHARGYEEVIAWRCWDVARQLYPDHPMMREIAGIERRLEKDLPDFF